MEFSKHISNLFQSKQIPSSQPQAAPISNLAISDDTKSQGETYTYYGKRICGKVTASLPALSAFLPKIYNAEKQRQIEDVELQKQHKVQLSHKLDETADEIAHTKADISKSEDKITDINNSIEILKGKLIEAKNQHGDINKMAKIKLIIGLSIISILTVYLIIFYSSTFYSAFFKQFDANINIGDAMFDPQALPHAFSQGLGELIFILCAPIIFMGLGFSLHYFMQSRSWTKYIKTGSVLLITFIFDCILAYLIAKKIYDIWIMTQPGDFPIFNLNLAIKDINVWAVIFCGFIVYLIWGIVFDLTLTAYEDIRSNRKEIDKLEDNIQTKKDILFLENDNLKDKKAKLEALEAKYQRINKEIALSIHFDTQIIKVALSDFFTGWIEMMNGLSRPKSEQDSANQIYETTINQLFIQNI